MSITITPRENLGPLTREDLAKLSQTFPPDAMGVKIQSLSKTKDRAMLVQYLQHTDVYNRLEEVDPMWSCDVVREEQVGQSWYVTMKLTLKGTTRVNVGEGSDPKGAFSDALKRAAMLFGVGRWLYDSETVWVEYNEQKDRFRQWTMEDFNAARKHHPKAPATTTPPVNPPTQTTQGAPKKSGKVNPVVAAKGLQKKTDPSPSPTEPKSDRATLNRTLMNLYRPYLSKYPDTQFSALLKARYGVTETRLMTEEQLRDLVTCMETEINVK